MRCATYRRVSTEMQRDEGVSLQSQKERLEAYVVSQGWAHVTDYADEGFSAKNIERPALQRMINDIKQKKFDVLLVYRLDRFVRSVSDLHELLQLMDKYDVKFKSCTEVFDTTSATGRMFITIIATLAQWERETIAERVFDNMMHRSEQGKRNGAPAPFGYELVDGRLVVNEEQSPWVKLIFDKYETTGSQNIAKLLNKRGVRTKKGEVWSDFAVRYVLRNPLYAGYVRWNYRSTAKGKFTGNEVVTKYDQEDFQPIITKEQYDHTQKLMKERSAMAFRSDNHYPFSGIARCSKCGNKFSGSSKKRSSGSIYRFYKCAGRFQLGICDVQPIAEESIEKVFLESLSSPQSEVEVNTDRPKHEIDKEQLEKEIGRLQGRKERAEELYLEGDIPKDRYTKMMQDIRERELEIMDLLNQEEEDASQEELHNWLQNVKDEWYNLSYEARKAAVRAIFESITLNVVVPTKPGKYAEPPILAITDYQFR